MPSSLYAGPIAAGTDASVTTAAAMQTDTPCRSVVIQADSGNGSTVAFGDAAAQPLLLAAGQSLSLRVNNLNQIFRKATSGTQTIHWIIEL